MKKHQILVLLVVVCMLATTVLSACTTTAPTTAPTSAPAVTTEASASAAADATTEPAKTLEPYTFTHYFSYDYWDITHKWGADAVSKYYQDKYNITVEFSKPDSDPKGKLNVMISSGDLPDSIMMDRGEDNIKMAGLNLLVPLEPFMANDKDLEKNVLPNTIKQLQIGGKLYGIPNWPRKGATGGNDAWLYDTRLYAAAGSPALNTMDDMYNYALKVKTDVKKTKEGVDVVPVIFDNATLDGQNMGRAFYRSFGGQAVGWYSISGGKYQSLFRDPTYKEAIMEANKWWRAGLFSPTQFSDTVDQILEKIVAGRTALLFYDHSKDATNKFRKILMQNHPDDTIEMVSPFPYPPAKGLPTSKIYPDYKETIGWNVTCITTKATQPERIFQLWTSFLTQEGSIIMMYGPKGGNWDTLNDQGLPLLKVPEAKQTTDQINALGCWFWAIPGQSDNVDNTKFAVNKLQPKESQDWVISHQSDVLSPIMYVDDEFIGIADVVDATSPDGVARTLCEDHIKAQLPKVIMAASADEASKLFDEINTFLDANGMPAIETAYNKKWTENVALVGTVTK
jgi:putative aldouronate transport system substrate-binding protein